MKPENIHHEILLFTDNSFSQREFCSRDEKGSGRKLSPVEELERACWAGMLFEMLPELTAYSLPGSKMFIWNIRSAERFLLINQGTDPHPVEAFFSIDPQLFYTGANFN